MHREALQHAVRSTGAFGRYGRLLRESEGWSQDRIREVQGILLRAAILDAYRTVPYYRSLFDRRGIRPDDIRTADDLSALPLMDKYVLRSEFSSLRSRSRLVPGFRAYTSGTSGTPVVVLRGMDNIRFEHAAFCAHDRWAGLRQPVRRFSLVGRRVIPHEQSVPPFWRRDRFGGELAMSSYHLLPENLDAYLAVLKRYRPEALRAVPSTAQLFAHHLLSRGITLPLKAVFTQSEQLTDSQRRDIEAAFQTRVYDRYGNAERVAAFFQCAHGSYHELPLYSVVEYLPLKQDVYEVVGTTLHNRVLPLLRYRTGDLVVLSASDFCPCGRPFRVIESLTGRMRDMFVMEDGSLRYVRSSELVKGMTWLKESQIVQERVDSIVLRVVPMPGATVPPHEELVDQLTRVIGGPRSTFRIEVTDAIPREQNGKLKSIKSLVNA